jgi:Phosphotransferase enzyme family
MRVPQCHAQPDYAMDLPHNRNNAVTASLALADWNGRPAVRKVLTGHNRPSTPPHWRTATAARHWNYWRREALVYESGPDLRDCGIAMPQLLSRRDLDNGDIELLLERLGGRTGVALRPEDYAATARTLGRMQGRLASAQPAPEPAWLSRNFIADYCAGKPADFRMLTDDAAWRQPLIRAAWPADLRAGLIRLHAHRSRLATILRGRPRTLCHLDVWPNNVFAGDGGAITLIDWGFTGDGALGEDIGNLIPDSAFDGFVHADQLPEFAAQMIVDYLAGLHEAGWRGSEDDVRLAVHASAMKYDWMAPLMLARAAGSAHPAYGGGESPDAAALYRQRGATLALLARWADAAVAAAGE